MYAEPSLPLTRKVARRRRDGRRERKLYQFFGISPSVIFHHKNDSSLVRGSLCLLMRIGAPHKIDRCADRCSLYPPQARPHILPEDGAEALTKFDIKFGLALCIKFTAKIKPTADNGGLILCSFYMLSINRINAFLPSSVHL